MKFLCALLVGMVYALEFQKGDAVIAVDGKHTPNLPVQNDFISGSLATTDEPLQGIFDFLNNAISQNIPVIATRDWHPANHSSFTPQGGKWPPHCVQGTAGAEFPAGFPAQVTVISKGTLVETDAYSGFQGTALGDRLLTMNISRVFVLGYCTEYCVMATALDAAKKFKTIVIKDLSAPVNKQDVPAALKQMEDNGIALI